jgi:FG-GAP repeat protein
MIHSRRIAFYALVLCLLTNLYVPLIFASAHHAFSTQTKLVADSQTQVDNYGTAIDIDGNTAVVSGLGNRFRGYPDGAVFVYVREGANWTLQQTLSAHDEEPNADDSYGLSVAISGDTLVVGALGDSTAGFVAGAAYVYVRNGTTWSLQQKLTAGDPAPFSSFGISVAVTGDTVVVGAHGDDDAGYGTGAAYVFRRNAGVWTEQQKLKASDAVVDASFGLSVSISGQTIAVGAPSLSSPGANFSGAVYTFINNGSAWLEQQKIKAHDITAGQQLGYCVAISGETIVATAPGEIVGMHTYGAVYIFKRNGTTWHKERKLIDRDVARTDGFGLRAAIDGDTIVIGDITDNTAALWGGAGYVYVRNGNAGWSLKYTLTATDAAYADFLGLSVAISGNTIMLGAPQKNEQNGAVYIYQ